MLATAEQVQKAMSLGLHEVRAAMSLGGYPDKNNEITDVAFKGFNGVSFVYEFTYPDPEDEGTVTGLVFIKLKRQPFSTNYDFYAEY